MKSKADEYIQKKEKWTAELTRLRAVFSELPLNETLKWGAPTYVFNGKNVVGIAAFKNYFGLWFFQGGLLKDVQQKLINAQEEKTKAMRQWKLHSMDEIDESLIKKYVLEAIENVKNGIEIKPQKSTKKELILPAELQKVLKMDIVLNTSFEKFTLSKKREFSDYISEAKREITKSKRIEKIIPMIKNGIGLNDKYRNC